MYLQIIYPVVVLTITKKLYLPILISFMKLKLVRTLIVKHLTLRTCVLISVFIVQFILSEVNKQNGTRC